MQENNFEKQVREKMEELSLAPADSVWPKVFLSIEKRKGRRSLVGLVLLLLLITAGSIIFIIQRDDHAAISSIENNPAGKATGAVPPTATKKQQGAPVNSAFDDKKLGQRQESTVNAIGENNTHVISKQLNTMPHQKAGGQHPLITNSAPKNYRAGKLNNTTDSYYQVNASGSKDTKVDYREKDDATEVSPQSTVLATVKSETESFKSAEQAATKQDAIEIQPTGSTAIPSILIANPLLLSSNEVREKPVIRPFAPLANNPGKKNSRWKVGINFSAGISATRDGYLGVIGLGGGDANKSFDQALSNSGSGGSLNPGSSFALSPPNITPGAGFTAGLFFQKNITPKTAVQVGLDYTLLTTRMRIGNRVDSVANFTSNNFFYRSGTNTKYINQFHFIALPVAVNIKIGRSSRLPVYLNTGLTVAQLVHTNALEFAPLNGALYNDKKLFNKTQLSVTASLLLSINGNATHQLLVGPQLNFGITNMANAGYYKGRHYSFAGIQLKKTLGKR